jgi:type II secretory pathway component PulC
MADESRVETASLLLRAWGNHSEVQRVRSAAPQKESALPREVRAGSIPRAALDAELANGIGRFLRHVKTEPVFFDKGQFKGWRLLALFPKRSDIAVAVLRAGDTLLRINGRSIERPEEFKDAWDSLANAKELVLDIERDGRESKLRYTIAP